MKPYKWSPITFKKRFKQLRALLPWFDTYAVPTPDDTQWKNIFVKKFYHKHVSKFNEFKATTHDTRQATVTIQTITEYMQNLWETENPTSVGRTEAEEIAIAAATSTTSRSNHSNK